MQQMSETVRALLANLKGLLAMDESNATCDKRFAAAGIPQTVEARRAYRELIITAPGLSECVSGLILYDETIRQSRADGTSFVKLIQDAGIVPGIKVDTGAKELAGRAGEKVTGGLDGLRERLRDYFERGARFAKWRVVIAIGEGRPSRACIEANAQALARYAALCQEAGIVPIVEPETVMDGAALSFAHVFVSPRLRARATCELADLGGQAKIEPDLAEWSYGDYEGRRSVDICDGRHSVPDPKTHLESRRFLIGYSEERA